MSAVRQNVHSGLQIEKNILLEECARARALTKCHLGVSSVCDGGGCPLPSVRKCQSIARQITAAWYNNVRYWRACVCWCAGSGVELMAARRVFVGVVVAGMCVALSRSLSLFLHIYA